ncbi:MAG: leucine--tRNA ligase [Dehalococcoidales bacterium]
MDNIYNPVEIENKWQKRWADDKLYKVSEHSNRPKWYALTMFPYTSGDLHIGHWYAMAPSDVHARFRRMQGFNVLHPIGFDAFGLPAENAAIKHGIHPYQWTMKNVDNMRKQLKTIGAIYDWDREIITCQPEYYKWTQWFFLKLYEHGLAYRKKAPVNWCPKCQTVLANEQVLSDGTCERCDEPVIHKDLEQWFFKITKYADELMQHEGLDWPERIKTMQHNWVGKSIGTEVSFELDIPGVPEKEIRVFTTRADTVYGVTFMVLAPENPLVAKITAPDRKETVEAYVTKARTLTEIERLSTEKEKDGVFTGAYVTNRLNGDKVPVWIADYALAGYGTGAVMGVPAHDERDFAFAKKYDLPVKVVISPPDWNGEAFEEAYVDDGIMVNSGEFNGTPNREGIDKVAEFLEEKGWGKRTVSYRLRDWLISRQRYWGAPIPMVYCQNCGIVPVPEQDLPVLLPEDAEFRPTGESPLKYCDHFVNTTCPKCGGPAKREIDTMDTFMCSSWYFLRYANAHIDTAAFDQEAVKYWLPVDLYTGGAEHAVMHLFYARFFTKALRDMGLIDFGEPFIKLFNQGIVISNKQKMSKSRGNVVNPDSYVSKMGADTVRCYLMFVAPWEQGGDWNDQGIAGIYRWLNRIWKLATEQYNSHTVSEEEYRNLQRITHQTIKKVTHDIDRIRFNTMISALMEYTNYLGKIKDAGSICEKDWEENVKILLLLLAPSAPHIAEELWQQTGHMYSIHNWKWPEWDEKLAADEEIPIVIQINGKTREKVMVSASVTEEEVKETVLDNSKVKAYLEGREIVKMIYVPKKLLNLVLK